MTLQKRGGFAQHIGVPLAVKKHGVDIGIDTSVANRRSTAKQKQRIRDTQKRACRTGYIAKIRHKARRMAVTGVATAQRYGHTAIGMSKTNVEACKRNVAQATGCMTAGACATTVLNWCFRHSKATNQNADPRISMPIEQIEAWMRIWRTTRNKEKPSIFKLWKMVHKTLKNVKGRWHHVNGPMPATIATMIDLGWDPIHPFKWLTPDRTRQTNFMDSDAAHHRVTHEISKTIEERIWQGAAKSYNSKGLEHGRPNLGPASQAFSKLLREGKRKEAFALEGVVLNRAWCNHRIAIKLPPADLETAERIRKCPRCNSGADDTPTHRYHTCPANLNIDSEYVKSTQYLCAIAVEDTAHECKWNRAILPVDLTSESVDWLEYEECEPSVIGDYVAVMTDGCQAGSDGSGGFEKNPRLRKMASASIT